ncbi:response regulator [Myxococcota bacterium]|nr:response regulator [Myxococcota bacterium]
MAMGIFHALLNNLTLLVSLGVLYSVILRKFPQHPQLRGLLSGVLFGCIALLGMYTPLHLSEGPIYDGRSIILSLAGLFGGPIAGLIAALIAMAGRLSIGGVGQWVGLGVIVESTALGILLYHLSKDRPWMLRWPALWGFSFLVHVGMVLIQLGMPADIRWQVVSQIWAPVLLLYPLVSLLLAWIFLEQRAAAELENSLHAHEQLLQDILDAMPNPVTYRDIKGHYLACNRAFAFYTGHPVEEILGETVKGLLPDPEREMLGRKDTELLDNPGIQHIEMKIPCADGITRDILIDRATVHRSDGTVAGIVAVMSDQTEARELEAQLRQAQKLEAVGRLAGGVAHDFNNMLGVILGQTEELLDNLDETDPRRTELEEIRQAAQRSTELTRQLLAFARRQSVNPQLVDVGNQVTDSLRMLRRLIPENTAINYMPIDQPLTVLIDPAQFNQAVTNLVLNARDAIEKTGSITVTLVDIALKEPQAGVPVPVPAGSWIRLRVEDTGKGINSDQLEKIFEPFYTTKEIGKGTGLGLATVYGIVSQNHGFVQVNSRAGQGTTFDLFFPRHDAAHAPKAHAVHPRRSTDEIRKEMSESVVRPRCTILIAEDEEANLRLTARILTRAGHHVFSASSPAKAIEIFAAHKSEIMLLLTDVIMPEMNGMDLFLRLQEESPGLVCVFMSGYTADIMTSQGLDENQVHFLAKPFSRDDLLRAVHEALLPAARSLIADP